jgi:hypothetical protein
MFHWNMSDNLPDQSRLSPIPQGNQHKRFVLSKVEIVQQDISCRPSDWSNWSSNQWGRVNKNPDHRRHCSSLEHKQCKRIAHKGFDIGLASKRYKRSNH